MWDFIYIDNKTAFIMDDAKVWMQEHPYYCFSLLIYVFKIPLHTAEEFMVAYAKYSLNHLKVCAWKTHGYQWIVHLKTIVGESRCIRQRMFAGYVLKNIHYKVTSIKGATYIKSKVRAAGSWNHIDAKWGKKAMKYQKVPQADVIYCHLILNRTNLPVELHRKIASYL